VYSQVHSDWWYEALLVGSARSGADTMATCLTLVTLDCTLFDITKERGRGPLLGSIRLRCYTCGTSLRRVGSDSFTSGVEQLVVMKIEPHLRRPTSSSDRDGSQRGSLAASRERRTSRPSAMVPSSLDVERAIAGMPLHGMNSRPFNHGLASISGRGSDSLEATRAVECHQAANGPEPVLDVEQDHGPVSLLSQPKVKQYASAPAPRNSISKRVSAMLPGWRISW
jgi:hypothetical protein